MQNAILRRIQTNVLESSLLHFLRVRTRLGKRIQAKRSRILDAPNPDAGGTGMKRKFKLYHNRPSQRIDEMSANDLQLLKTKASSMANACGLLTMAKVRIFGLVLNAIAKNA